MRNRNPESIPWRWLALAIALRAVSALTHSSWFHPDEWFQTVEFANVLSNGFGIYSQEFGLHLRNLSWPWLLSQPLRLSEALFPGQVAPRLVLMNGFIGLMSLGMVWGWWQVTRAAKLSKGWRDFSLALLLLPWFSIYDSISPRIEQCSTVMAWVALGCLARGWHGRAGFAAVAIAAFRYPSGLISAAFGLSLLLRREWRPALRFAGGAVAGLAVFGVADWVYYGRPWESLWMYLQYNVFTGTSSSFFGSQPASAYWEFFSWRWLRYPILAPAGLALAAAAAHGLWIGFRKLEPWALATALYAAGHLAIAHKESRFAYPIEGFLLWAAVIGLQGVRLPRAKTLRWAAGAIFAANLAFLAHAAWGETWRASRSYWEIDRHLREVPGVCAVITVKQPMSPLLPWHDDPSRAPEPALGWTTHDRHRPSFEEARRNGVAWRERAPDCGPDGRVLVHVHRPDDEWEKRGCELQASAVLAAFPRAAWPWLLSHRLVNGPWYSCPGAALGWFGEQSTVLTVSRSFGRYESLPPLGITSAELIRLGKTIVPPPRDVAPEFR